MKTRETLRERLETEIAGTNIEPGIQQILKIALGRILEYQDGMKDPKADGTYWVGVDLEPFSIRGKHADNLIEFIAYARKHWPVAQQMADMAASAEQDVDLEVLTRKLIDGVAGRTSQQIIQLKQDLLAGIEERLNPTPDPVDPDLDGPGPMSLGDVVGAVMHPEGESADAVINRGTKEPEPGKDA